MKADPPISVIIPTYNRANLICRAICSVLIAMAPGDELIVVDDGSEDSTAAVLESNFGDRIRYVRKKNNGVGAARNTGVSLARHPLIAFNDSDDEWFADKLVLQRAFMRARPDAVFCFTDLGIRRPDGSEDLHGLRGWHNDPRSWDKILGPGVPYSRFAPLPSERDDFHVHIGDMTLPQLRVNHVATQSALVRRELAGDALRFPEDIQLHEDLACFARLAWKGPAAYLDCATVWQWGHSGPRLSRVSDVDWSLIRIKMLEDTFGADPEFMSRYHEIYGRTLRTEHLKLARSLIATGKTADARRELRLAGRAPFSYWALAAMPGRVVNGLLGVRRALVGSGRIATEMSVPVAPPSIHGAAKALSNRSS